MPTNQLNLINGSRINAKEERQKEDFYATDPNALIILLDQLKKDGIIINKNVWESACGLGHLSEVLERYGYSVFNTDLVDRGYNKFHLAKNFFEFKTVFDGDILTNPPYKFAKEFILHSLDLIPSGHKVIMFLKIQFLETQNRYDDVFSKYPPKYIYVFSNRVDTAMNGEFEKYKKCSPSSCYTWFIWEKDYKGEPVIRWLHK